METQREVDPCDWDMWRSIVRTAVRAASQLLGGEPTDVDGAPADDDENEYANEMIFI